jgi:hypothetical protein
MSNRAVVCVATTPAYQKGMDRLQEALMLQSVNWRMWSSTRDWPSHSEKPYAFKAYAMHDAVDTGADTLLWADACMLPVQDMTPLWERIERDGYWFSRNGWSNYEWTADSAYPDLFPGIAIDDARRLNKDIPHVVATCFGISLKHLRGRHFLKEYYRLASETKAFCGPWTNCTAGCEKHASHYTDQRFGNCGPADVRGHRHDQTAASVIAWRLGVKLTDPPEIFAYGKAGEPFDPRTIMIADGAY